MRIVAVIPVLMLCFIARSSAAVQNGSELRIISAVFGAREGSIDLTSIVRDLVQPGSNEFYATPKWLHFDPARTFDKDLTIEYEYRGEHRNFTTPERGAVSYDILREQAQALPTPVSTNINPDGGLKIILAYFGIGGTFVDVTDKVAARIHPGSGEFVANASSMGVDPLPNWTKDLIVTYEFEGKRRNFFTPNSGSHLVSYEILVENARINGMASTHTNSAPDWFASAHPMAIANAGAFAVPATPLTATERLAQENANNPNPRAPGHAPHIEAAITALLSAQEALGRDSLPSAMASIQRALTNARATIAYVFPPPDRELAKISSEKALASLNMALNEFLQATPGGKGQFLPNAIEETRQAIEAVSSRR